MNELLISLVLSWIAGCFAELVSLIDFNSFPVMNENKFNEFGNPAIRSKGEVSLFVVTGFVEAGFCYFIIIHSFYIPLFHYL